MMNTVRPYPVSDATSAYPAKLGSVLNSHTLTVGKGLRVLQTMEGNHVELVKQPKKDNATLRGSYNFLEEYWPGDVVTVDSTSSYTDQNGNPISNIGVGGWICLNHIPAGINSSSFFLSVVVPAFTSAGATANSDMANQYRWYSNNVYYPTSLTFGTQSAVSSSGYVIQTSMSFWQPIGGTGGGGWQLYNPSQSYSANCGIVFVDPNQNYGIPNVVTPNSASAPPICPGAFWVINTVPAATSGSRPSSSYYYPIYPLWPTSSVFTLSGSTFNQIYFEPISPLQLANYCIPGQAGNVSEQNWINSIPVSASYQYALATPL